MKDMVNVKLWFVNMVFECDKNVIFYVLLVFLLILVCVKNKIFKLYIDVLLNVFCKIWKIKLNYVKIG